LLNPGINVLIIFLLTEVFALDAEVLQSLSLPKWESGALIFNTHNQSRALSMNVMLGILEAQRLIKEGNKVAAKKVLDRLGMSCQAGKKFVSSSPNVSELAAFLAQYSIHTCNDCFPGRKLIFKSQPFSRTHHIHREVIFSARSSQERNFYHWSALQKSTNCKNVLCTLSCISVLCEEHASLHHAGLLKKWMLQIQQCKIDVGGL
jgi:hypothetical protein